MSSASGILAGIAPPTRLVGSPTAPPTPADRVVQPSRPFASWLRERTGSADAMADRQARRADGVAARLAETGSAESADDAAAEPLANEASNTATRSPIARQRSNTSGPKSLGTVKTAPASTDEPAAAAPQADAGKAVTADFSTIKYAPPALAESAGIKAPMREQPIDAPLLDDAAAASAAPGKAASRGDARAGRAGGPETMAKTEHAAADMKAEMKAETMDASAGAKPTPAQTFASALDAASTPLPVSAPALAPNPASPAIAAAAPAATATVAVPVESPAFAAALGVEVSVLAKGGVQQAELHLNPAELGPLSIRIDLDGSAAHIDFAAEHAATRAAIENGLPELASAMREAGFTLAGGGVFARNGNSSDGGSDEGGSERRIGRSGRGSGRSATIDDATLDDIAATAAARCIAVRDGGVDLYA